MNIGIRWLPAILWMAVIFYMSNQTGSELNTLLPFFHRFFPAMQSFNWGHFIAYFILGLTFYWAWSDKKGGWSGKLLAIAACVAYGITDEYHQSFIADRTPDPMDLRNDAIGAALAMLLVSIPFVRKRYEQLSSAIKYKFKS